MDQTQLSHCCIVAMAEARMTRTEMARMLGVSVTTVSNYRSGKVGDTAKLQAFAEACGMDLIELLKKGAKK